MLVLGVSLGDIIRIDSWLIKVQLIDYSNSENPIAVFSCASLYYDEKFDVRCPIPSNVYVIQKVLGCYFSVSKSDRKSRITIAINSPQTQRKPVISFKEKLYEFINSEKCNDKAKENFEWLHRYKIF